MSTTLQKLDLELSTTAVTIKGELIVSDNFWCFTSKHPAFERLFPTSCLYSATPLPASEGNAQRLEMHQAITNIVASLRA